MEAISNIASTATTTVSTLIYGEGQNNETAGKEPVSGQQGEGTAADPYDHGNLPTPMQPAFVDKSPIDATAPATNTTAGSNDFLKLNPVVKEPQKEDEVPKVEINTAAPQPAGMTILPLTDAATQGVQAPVLPTAGAEATAKAEVTDKDKATGATPGAIAGVTSPAVPESADVKTSDLAVPLEKPQLASADVSPRTSAPPSVAAVEKEGAEKEMSPAAKRISMLSKNPFGDKDKEKEKSISESKSGSVDKKANRLSMFKGKLKDKLHIGSKDGAKDATKDK